MREKEKKIEGESEKNRKLMRKSKREDINHCVFSYCFSPATDWMQMLHYFTRISTKMMDFNQIMSYINL